jgi:hypothetical protein
MTQDQVAEDVNETTQNVQKLYNLVLQVQPISLYKFVINPSSFAESVENLFHLSFLVRDGKISIEEGEHGDLIVEACEPPTEEDFQNGLQKIQSVFHFDKHLFDKAIKKYNITESLIPRS